MHEKSTMLHDTNTSMTETEKDSIISSKIPQNDDFGNQLEQEIGIKDEFNQVGEAHKMVLSSQTNFTSPKEHKLAISPL